MRFMSMVLGAAVIAGTVGLGTGAALATERVEATGTEASQQQRAGRADPSRRVCRSLQPTGSRLPIRSCRTQQEWDDEAERSRRGMDDAARMDDVVRPGTEIITTTPRS